MSTRRRGISPKAAIVTAFFLVAGAAFAVGALLGQRFSHYHLCVLLVVFLLALVVVLFSARRGESERLGDVLREIAEGGSAWRKTWAVDSAAGGLGKNVKAGVEAAAEAVESLKADLSRLELVLANITDGILAVDADHRVILVNPTATSLLGQKQSQIVGRTTDDADLHPEMIRLLHDCFQSSQDLESEITVPGQVQRVLKLRATRCRVPGRKPDCVLLLIQDLTELRRQERYGKEFVSNVTHEIKTPIAAIRSTAETLLTGAKNDPDVADRFLNTIMSESDRLSLLIEDIMEIAKIDSGVGATDKAISNVYDVVERAVGLLRTTAEQKGLTLNVNVSKQLTGYFDPNQMVPVIRNLADNAVKYTPDPGTVDVTAHAEGEELFIVVKDTGIGIPHGEIDRIFDRFYRVDKARSRRIGGTGLGLAIVKDIVEAHGGRITVDSQLGHGSTFTVHLPGPSESSK